MTVRDGIYAVLAFIANTLIRCIVTGRTPVEGKEADYINTLCEHYKFILTVFQNDRSIQSREFIDVAQTNGLVVETHPMYRISKEETETFLEVALVCSDFPYERGAVFRTRRCGMTLTAERECLRSCPGKDEVASAT